MNNATHSSRTLEELHRIREAMYEETKRMSFEEKIKYWERKTDEALSRDGYKYVETSEGTKILKK